MLVQAPAAAYAPSMSCCQGWPGLDSWLLGPWQVASHVMGETLHLGSLADSEAQGQAVAPVKAGHAGCQRVESEQP